MSMDPNMASAFAAGSGIDPNAMKATILSLTGGVLLLVLMWVISILWESHQAGHISSGEVFASIAALSIVLTVLFVFMGWY